MSKVAIILPVGAGSGIAAKGHRNAAFGPTAGNRVSGSNNVAMGRGAGSDIAGSSNIAIGEFAGKGTLSTPQTMTKVFLLVRILWLMQMKHCNRYRYKS